MGNTDFLFSSPSFLNGIARTIDIFGSLTEYNISETPDEADTQAIMNDGRAIQKDLSQAFQIFEEEKIE